MEDNAKPLGRRMRGPPHDHAASPRAKDSHQCRRSRKSQEARFNPSIRAVPFYGQLHHAKENDHATYHRSGFQ